MFDECAAEAVTEEGEGLWAVFLFDFAHFLGDVFEGFVPGGFFPFIFATFADSDEGSFEAVVIEVGTYATGATRAEATVAEGVFWVTDDFFKFTI